MQDFQKQLEALDKLRCFLESYRADLDIRLGTYRSCVQNMRTEGVPTQFAGTYEQNYYVENENCIKRVIDNIDGGDLPYIKKKMEQIEDLLRG